MYWTTSALSPEMIFTATPRPFMSASASRAPSSGRSRNVRKPVNVRSRSVSRSISWFASRGRTPTARTRTPWRPQASYRAAEPRPLGVVQRPPIRQAHARAEHGLERALRHDLPCAFTLDADATRLRLKSNGTSPSLRRVDMSGRRDSRTASSRGLAMPEASAALMAPRASTSADGAPEGLYAPSSRMTPSVSVPVLSVHSTSMLPRFSIAFSRRTITPRVAMTCAPLARFTARMAGSNSGLRPTARATEKSSVSIGGRPCSMCAVKTRRTSKSIAIVSR